MARVVLTEDGGFVLYEEKMTTLPELLAEVLEELLSVSCQATSSTQELQLYSFPSLKDRFFLHFLF